MQKLKLINVTDTYLIAELRLWYQSLRSSWLLDMSRSFALGKVNCGRGDKEG